jgi:hypothetical protein
MTTVNNVKIFPTSERLYFTSIPNVVACLNLSPHAFRLYFHFKEIAGVNYQNSCEQSEDTLALVCNFSTGKISAAKQELVKKGLIKINLKKTTRGKKHSIKVIDIEKLNIDFFNNVKKTGNSAFSSKIIEPRTKKKRNINTSSKRKKQENNQTFKTNATNIKKIKPNSYTLNIDWLEPKNNPTKQTEEEKTMIFDENSENFDIKDNVEDNKIDFDEFVKLYNEKNKPQEPKIKIDTISNSFSNEEPAYKKFLSDLNLSVKCSQYETQEEEDLNNKININNININKVNVSKEINTVKENLMFDKLSPEQKNAMDKEFVRRKENIELFLELKSKPNGKDQIKSILNSSRQERWLDMVEFYGSPQKVISYLNKLVKQFKLEKANSEAKQAEFHENSNNLKNNETILNSGRIQESELQNDLGNIDQIDAKPKKKRATKTLDVDSVEYQNRQEYKIAQVKSKKTDRKQIQNHIKSLKKFQGVNFAKENRWIILLTAKYSVKNIIECLNYLIHIWETKDRGDIRWRPSCNSIWKHIEAFNAKVESGDPNYTKFALRNNKNLKNKEVVMVNNTNLQEEKVIVNFNQSKNKSTPIPSKPVSVANIDSLLKDLENISKLERLEFNNEVTQRFSSKSGNRQKETGTELCITNERKSEISRMLELSISTDKERS